MSLRRTCLLVLALAPWALGPCEPLAADGPPQPAPQPPPQPPPPNVTLPATASPPAAPPAAPAPAAGAPTPSEPPAAGQPGPGGAAPAPAGEVRPLEFLPDSSTILRKADQRMVYFYRTNFVTADDLIKSLALMKLASSTGKDAGLGVTLTPFPAQNQVLIEGRLDDVQLVLDTIEFFDVATPQVFIEAKVLEVTHDSNFEYGLDYLFDRNVSGPDTIWRGIGSILSPPSALSAALPGGLPFQGTNLLFGLVGANAIDVGAFDLAFRALQESGKADVLSQPSIICAQGNIASVKTTENFRVNRLRSATTRQTGPDTSSDEVSYESAPASTGVELEVEAKHIGGQFVTIRIKPKVTGLAGFASRIGGTLQQIETTREASTTITMADKQTFWIGGLYSNRTVREEARTPLLSDVPLIGSIFTRQHETKQKIELIFLLKPTIIRKDNDPRIITPPDELKRLEKKPTEGATPGCGWCEPERSIEDALFPKQALCREEAKRQAARQDAQEAAKRARPTSSAGLPPPPAAPVHGPTAAPGAPPASATDAPAPVRR